MRSRAARRVWKWSAATFAVIVILLAVAVGLFRLLLPLAPGYHEQIELWASQAVGYPVRLNDIDARWRLGGPELAFSQVEVLSPDGSRVLFESASGSVGVSILKLVRERSISPNRIVLDRADLNIVRTADGRVRFQEQQSLAGGELGHKGFPVGSIYLRDARVTFHDQQLNRGPWTFDDLRLRLAHEADALRLEGQADLPASLGERLRFGLQADGVPENLADASWTFELNGTALNLSGIAALVPEKLPAMSDGTGNLEMLASLRGTSVDFMRVTGDFDNVAFSQPAGHVLDHVSADVKWERKPGGWRVSGERIAIESAGTIWPETQFVVDWRSGQSKEPDLLYADASFMRLEDIGPFATWIPDASLRAFFLEQIPRGTVHDVSLHRSVSEGSLSGFSLRGSFDRLGLDAAGSLPGFDGLNGSIRADANGGEMSLSSDGLSIDLPALYTAGQRLDELGASVDWQRDASRTVVSVAYDLLAPGTALRGDGRVTLPVAGSVEVDANVDIARLDVARIAGLLPDRRLPPQVKNWFSDAMVAGRIESGTARFRGPVNKFPFDNDEGEFEAQLVARDATLAYAKGWPAIEDATITTVFRNASVDSKGSGGTSSGLRLMDAHASIVDLREGNLVYESRVKGTFADTLTFMRNSAPIKDRAGKLLEVINGRGSAETQFRLNLPLKNRDAFDFDAAMTLADATLAIDGMPHEITDIEGVMKASRSAITSERLSGAILGRPVVATVEPAKRESGQLDATLIRINGRVASSDLADNVDAGLARYFEGETGWNGLLRLPAVVTDPVTLTLMSDLSGLAVLLPEPLDKPADLTAAFSLGLEFASEGELGFTSRFDNRMQAVGELVRSDERWRIGRGNVAFGDTAPRLTATEDIVISGNLERLALADWLALGGGGSGRPDRVKSLDLAVGELDLFGQKLADARMLVDRNPDEWLVQLRSETVDGSVFLPKDIDTGAPIVLDMVKLHVQTTRPADSAARPDPPDPRSWPPLQIRAADFAIGERLLGRLTAEAIRGPDGLELTRIATESPSFSTEGTGAWRQLDAGRQQTEFRTTLSSSELETTLRALGFASNVEADSAELSLDVRWPGSPASDFMTAISGTCSFSTGAGQFRDIDPGAGRVFGLLSLSALPRRLSLDFRDVFDKGFGFDSISGDFVLENGNAYTNNLVLEGPAADVGIIGRTGLSKRDYDQTAVVRANVGSALPVAGAIAIGPGVGAALLILSEIFKDPLKDMSRIHYRITGDWDNPDVQRVQPSELAASGEPEPALRN